MFVRAHLAGRVAVALSRANAWSAVCMTMNLACTCALESISSTTCAHHSAVVRSSGASAAGAERAGRCRCQPNCAAIAIWPPSLSYHRNALVDAKPITSRSEERYFIDSADVPVIPVQSDAYMGGAAGVRPCCILYVVLSRCGVSISFFGVAANGNAEATRPGAFGVLRWGIERYRR